MRYTRKANKKDLLKKIFDNSLFAIPFGAFGVGFLFINDIPIGGIIVCIIFILVSLCFTIPLVKLIFIHLILNKPYEYYVTTCTLSTDNTTSSTKFYYIDKGHRIGLPDKFKDLTKAQNELLDKGIYVIGQPIDEFAGPKFYNYESIENNNNMSEKIDDSKYDPFSKDNCKYNIDKDDPFDDFYNKSKK